VRYVGPEPRPSPEEEEQMIFAEVEDLRHGNRITPRQFLDRH
jgi:hypothetical protein